MAISSALGGTVGAVPIGSVTAFAGSAVPSGWLLCGGQTVSRTQYSGLFLTIGTTYGAGDGSTTFALPDLRGRTIAGEDDMGGTAANRLTSGVSGINGIALGASGGSQILHTHSHPNTLTSNVVASDGHSHAGQGSLNAAIGATNGDPSRIGYIAGTVAGPGTATYSITGGSLLTNSGNFNHYTPVYGSTGGNSGSTTVGISNANAGTGSSQNVQPTMILNYIIRAA
jgi:microcystin-dependent protein